MIIINNMCKASDILCDLESNIDFCDHTIKPFTNYHDVYIMLIPTVVSNCK